MPKLIVIRGLQGSGKSTAARHWVAADPTRRVRVNVDGLRTMGHNGRDFRRPRSIGRDGKPGPVNRPEAMLAYVAVTRAQHTLDRGSLACIDDEMAVRLSSRRPDWEESHAQW